MITLEQESSVPKLHTFGPQIYRYVFEDYGILYTSSNSIPGPISNLNDTCRFQFVNGTILQGSFMNGESKQATHMGRYPLGWAEAEWKEGGVNGNGQLYDKNGVCYYEGQLRNGVQNGVGSESIGSDYLTGHWKNGLKHGAFNDKLRNYSITGIGEYKYGLKTGKWHYEGCGESLDEIYPDVDERPDDEQRLAQYTMPIHKLLMTQTDYQRILSFYQMLTDNIVSAWASYLQQQLCSKGRNDVLLFSIDAIKKFSGIDHTYQDYKRSKMINKHAQGRFHICSLIQQQEKTLIFPIIRGNHFYMVAIRVSKKGERDYQFVGEVYDSLGGSGNSGQVVRKYLIQEMADKCDKGQVQQILKGISQMKFEVKICPRQSDGYSCGVFVCITMEKLCNGQELGCSVDRNFLNDYRQKIHNALSSVNRIPYLKLPIESRDDRIIDSDVSGQKCFKSNQPQKSNKRGILFEFIGSVFKKLGELLISPLYIISRMVYYPFKFLFSKLMVYLKKDKDAASAPNQNGVVNDLVTDRNQLKQMELYKSNLKTTSDQIANECQINQPRK